jgi:hypothetical protein
MKVWIERYYDAGLFRPKEPTIAIRIFDPGARPYPRASVENPSDRWDNCPEAPWDYDAYLAVIEHTFSDVNPDLYPEEVQQDLDEIPNIILFNEQMAENILTKFSSIHQQATSLFLHCNAGISRSPAIAFALRDIFKLSFEWQDRAARFCASNDGYIGNAFVYRIMRETAIDKNH